MATPGLFADLDPGPSPVPSPAPAPAPAPRGGMFDDIDPLQEKIAKENADREAIGLPLLSNIQRTRATERAREEQNLQRLWDQPTDRQQVAGEPQPEAPIERTAGGVVKGYANVIPSAVNVAAVDTARGLYGATKAAGLMSDKTAPATALGDELGHMPTVGEFLEGLHQHVGQQVAKDTRQAPGAETASHVVGGLAPIVIPGAGIPIAAASAGGNKYLDMRNMGASEAKARTAAGINAAVMALLPTAGRAGAGVTNTIGQTVERAAGKVLSEGASGVAGRTAAAAAQGEGANILLTGGNAAGTALHDTDLAKEELWAGLTDPTLAIVGALTHGAGEVQRVRQERSQQAAIEREQSIIDQDQARTQALQALDPNKPQVVQREPPPQLWSDIQRQQALDRRQAEIDQTDVQRQRLADEEQDGAAQRPDLEQLAQAQRERDAYLAQQAAQQDLVRRRQEEQVQADAEASRLQAEQRAQEREQAHEEVQQLTGRLAAFERESASNPAPNPLERAKAQHEIEQQRAALDDMRAELEAQRAPQEDRTKVKATDIIDVIRDAGGITPPTSGKTAEIDAWNALPAAVKRMVTGTKRSATIDKMANQLAATHGFGDGTTNQLLTHIIEAVKERRRSATAQAAVKPRPLSPEESYQQGVEVGARDAKATEPRPADTSAERQVAESLRRRLADARKRLEAYEAVQVREKQAREEAATATRVNEATRANEERARRLAEEENPQEVSNASRVRENQTQADEGRNDREGRQVARGPNLQPEPSQVSGTRPVGQGSNRSAGERLAPHAIAVRSVADLHRGLREVYGLSHDEATVATALVRAHAASKGVDADVFTRSRISEVRRGKGDPILNQRGHAATTLDQRGTVLDAPGKSLAFDHLKRQWEKAHGERLQPQSETWQQLEQRARKIDEQRGNTLYQGLNDAPAGKGSEKGAVSFASDGRAVLHALKNPDVSTAVHELFHIFRRTLDGRDADIAAHWAGAKRQKDGSWTWGRAAEERLARAGERYVREGVAPTKALQGVFDKLKTWLSTIYQSIKGTPIDQQISPEMRGVFERMFTPAKGHEAAINERNLDVPRESKPSETSKGQDPLAAFDAETKRLRDEAKERLDRTTDARQREYINKQAKGQAMSRAAERRAMVQGDPFGHVEGGLTPNELSDARQRAGAFERGRPVTVNGRKGVISSLNASFGKHEVEFEDGTKARVDHQALLRENPPRDKIPGASPRAEPGKPVSEPEPIAGDSRQAEPKPAPVQGQPVDRQPAAQPAARAEAPKDQQTATGETVVGNSNAMSAETRKRLGLPDRETPEGRTFDEMFDAGKKKADADPNAIPALIEELRRDPERIIRSDVESGMLLKHKVDLENDLARLRKAADDAHTAGDLNGELEARANLASQRKAMVDFTEMMERAGTAAGRALVARKMMSTMDHSLSHMEAEAAAAKGAPLTDVEAKKVDILYQSIEKANAAAQKRAQARLDELEGKMKARDFSKSYKPPAMERDAETIRLQTELEGAKRRYREMVRDFEKANRSRTRKVADFVGNLPGQAKSLKASLDNSAVFRQGWRVMMTNPTIWARNALRTFVDAYKVLGGKNVMDEIHAELKDSPYYEQARRAKLAIIAPEEDFPVSLPARIPLLGRVFKASEEAYTGFQYRNRMQVFERMMKVAERSGIDVNDTRQLRSIGRMINSLTSRGDLGKLEPVGNILNNVFFSARKLKADFDFLTVHSADTDMTAFARKHALYNLVKVVSGTAMILMIANAAAPGSVEEDPRSANFGKIKIGNTRYDVTGGVAPLLHLAARLATGTTKSATTGKVRSLNDGKFGSQTRADVIGSFFGNKLSPTASVVMDHMRGRTFDGKPPTMSSDAWNLLVPMAISNFVELQKDTGATPASITAGVLADFMGIGTNTYSATKPVPHPSK